MKASAKEFVPGELSASPDKDDSRNSALLPPSDTQSYSEGGLQWADAKEYIPQQQQPMQPVQTANAGAMDYIEYADYGPTHGILTQESSASDIKLSARAAQPLPQRLRFNSSKIDPFLYAHFRNNMSLMLERIPLSDPRNMEVPEKFCLVNPLEDTTNSTISGSVGYPSTVYKVCSVQDSLVYCLRRVDKIRGVKHFTDNCTKVMNMWKAVQSPSIIPLRQISVHKNALLFFHDYIPGATSLEAFVASRNDIRLTERQLWSIAIQMFSAARKVHDLDMHFFHGLTPRKVLFTVQAGFPDQFRVHISNVGMTHMLCTLQAETLDYQKRDISSLCRMLLGLACIGLDRLSIEECSTRYSPEWTRMLLNGLEAVEGVSSAVELLGMCTEIIVDELDAAYFRGDALEERLSMQLENSRINRLLLKLNLITERPEYGKNPQDSWAETEDRYIIKLFRNYVFHQVDENGRPWLAIGHIITSLNKLDIGSEEKILLRSSDGKYLLAITFADVRKCLESAFEELLNGSESQRYYNSLNIINEGDRAARR